MTAAVSLAPVVLDVPDSMKTKTLEGFGARLAAIRQARGLTQTELGAAAGVSQRVIAYYETESTQPPGALLVDFARALKVSSDELLGLTTSSAKTSPVVLLGVPPSPPLSRRAPPTHGRARPPRRGARPASPRARCSPTILGWCLTT